MNSLVIFDFNISSDLQNWRVVDDVVMGGQSSGEFHLNNEGFGVFSGNVSLENNGGFSSVRYRFQKINVKGYKKALLKLKGDGKTYQFRVKVISTDYYYYVASFDTSGEWEEIEITLEKMYASFRGRTLNLPNFSANSIEEITFLIGNKKPESFKLLLDKIELQ